MVLLDENDGEEVATKNRRNKRGGDDDDDDDAKGGVWEHEKFFTGDDETVGNNSVGREDPEPEISAPPEIIQQSKTCHYRVPKEEPSDNSPSIPVPSRAARGTPSSSKSAEGKRRLNGDDVEESNHAPHKKVKTENEQEPSIKEEPASPKGTPSVKMETSTSTSTSGPVTEEEIRAILMQKTPVTTLDLVSMFKGRLNTPEEKSDFTQTMRRISKIQNANRGSSNYVVLRAGLPLTSRPVTEEEIRAILMQKTPITTSDLVAKFKGRLETPEEKSAFVQIMGRISKLRKANGGSSYYVVLIGGSTSTSGPVAEEEIRAILMQKAPVTTQDLVAKFKARLKTPETKTAFATILRRISKIQWSNGRSTSHIVLREDPHI